MFTSILLLAFLSVSLGRPMDNPEWKQFKLKFGKVYADEAEEEHRYSIFLENLKEIEDHNDESYTKGINDFSDMTHEEFRKVYGGCYKVPEEFINGNITNEMYVPTDEPVANDVDWRQSGMVTRVKNQGQCGSCYTFSSTGALEGQHKKKTGTMVELSEQNLVDCTGSYGNGGCRGGWMDNCFKYIRDNRGIDSESYYGYYTRQLQYCYFSRSHVAATDTGFHDIPYGDEASLKSAVANVGPVSIAIDATHSSFKSYRSGVYYEPRCGSGLRSLDHAVLIVGYGTESGRDYWLVKNSWGNTWGDRGYIKMSRNQRNQCGIATKASYPTV